MDLKIIILRSLLLLVICVKVSNTARILGVFPTPCMSHQLVYQRFMEELLTRGHDLVVMSPDGAIYYKHPNLTVIDTHNASYNMWQSTYNYTTSQKLSSHQIMIGIKTTSALYTDADFSVPEMRALLTNESEHFDLIFVEMLNTYLTLFSLRFRAPLIGISSFGVPASSLEAVGNPINPLFYVDLTNKHIENKSLWTKFDNLYSFMDYKYIESQVVAVQNRVTMKHFGLSVPNSRETGENMAMLSLNLHPLFAGIRPAVPALLYLGGLHLRPREGTTKGVPGVQYEDTLATYCQNLISTVNVSITTHVSAMCSLQDLAAFVDNSKSGIVYLSFGSSVKLTGLSRSKIDIFLNVFRKLSFNFILKWENDTLPDKPTNVFTSQWLPQQDLLGHASIKAFVSQCGQQSIDETIHNGVPVLCLPFLLDQFVNSQHVEKLQIGRQYNFKLLDEESFKEALLDVVENKKYRKNIKRFAALMRDQKWTSIQRAVWWTEYVIRHKGAPHLKAETVSIYEYLMIDVIAVFITFLLIFTYLAQVTVRSLKFYISNRFL